MKAWELLDRSEVPGEARDLYLYRREDEFSIRSGHFELMNSRMHGSEDSLAELGCKKLTQQADAKVLIGGLGMGFTLGAALSRLHSDAEVVMAELVGAVIKWNQQALSELAGKPLQDPRVRLFEGDVGLKIRGGKACFDAILLDVDNGPEGLTRKENNALYSPAGLKAAFKALRAKGVLAVWSTSPEPRFTKRLQQAGFKVEEHRVAARGKRGGAKHTVWLAEKLSS
ncbi:MAG: hypothetical protein R8K49_03920 [Mariprofundaceae bacterium]